MYAESSEEDTEQACNELGFCISRNRLCNGTSAIYTDGCVGVCNGSSAVPAELVAYIRRNTAVYANRGKIVDLLSTIFTKQNLPPKFIIKFLWF